MPFGPEAGVPENAGVPDILGLRARGRLATRRDRAPALNPVARTPIPASSHVHGLAVVALLCVTVIAISGTGLSWFDAFGIPAGDSATGMRH